MCKMLLGCLLEGCLQGSSSTVTSLAMSSATIQCLMNLLFVELVGFLLPCLDFVLLSVSAAVPNTRFFCLKAGLSS